MFVLCGVDQGSGLVAPGSWLNYSDRSGATRIYQTMGDLYRAIEFYGEQERICRDLGNDEGLAIRLKQSPPNARNRKKK
jgi:hypothetical protein